MRKHIILIIIMISVAIFISCRSTGKRAVVRTIQEVFDEMAEIEFMRGGETYELPVGGAVMTGQKERFLRNRTAQEIIESKLSSGCGDFARVFIHLMQKFNLQILFIEGVEISIASLLTGFSGHVVVAVKDEKKDRWILTDPTLKTILSEDWSPDDRVFLNMYWIGYQGSLDDYSVTNAEELKVFYRKTLDEIPAGVWNRTIVGLNLAVDASLKTGDGGYINPNIPGLLRTIPEVMKKYGIHPERWADVLLVKGDEGYRSRMEYSEETGWVCRVGLQSTLSPSFISYLEHKVREH